MVGDTFLRLIVGRGRSRRRLSIMLLISFVVVPIPAERLTDLQSRTGPAVAGVAAAQAGWAERPPLHVARGGLDVATVNGTIVIMGGFDPHEPRTFDEVEGRQVTGDGAWRQLAPMPTRRANPAAAALGGKVYVAGGFPSNGSAGTDVVESYDPQTDTWSTVTKLPAGRGAAAAAALNGLLYVAGGYVAGPAGGAVSASVVAYDPSTRIWTAVAPMPTARWRLRLVAAGGRLFAIGGSSTQETSLTTVELYDPATNTWTTVAPMSQARSVPGVVVAHQGSDELIVVVGGCHIINGQGLPFWASTEVYSVNTGRWRTVQAQLPRGRCSLGSALEADGSVLAISGGVDDNGVVTATAEVHALKL